MRRLRSDQLMGLVPFALMAALLLALAPLCAMPACITGSAMAMPADTADHSCHGEDPCGSGGDCEPYMMVDGSPDALIGSEPPSIAIAAIADTGLASARLSAPAYLPVREPLLAFDDPLGVRLRI